MSFTPVFSALLNDLTQSITPSFNYYLDIRKSGIVRELLNRFQTFFRTLQVPVFCLSLKMTKHPKVADANLGRIGWARSSGNSQVMQFIY
jgi:hypothetical protein